MIKSCKLKKNLDFGYCVWDGSEEAKNTIVGFWDSTLIDEVVVNDNKDLFIIFNDETIESIEKGSYVINSEFGIRYYTESEFKELFEG